MSMAHYETSPDADVTAPVLWPLPQLGHSGDDCQPVDAAVKKAARNGDALRWGKLIA